MAGILEELLAELRTVTVRTVAEALAASLPGGTTGDYRLELEYTDGTLRRVYVRRGPMGATAFEELAI